MIKVLAPGFYTSIQDMGRLGYGDLGVPVSGAMDQFTAKMINRILGNKDHQAVLEITLGGGSYLFKKQANICVGGADFSPEINNIKIKLNTIISVKKNDLLTFGKPLYGARCYLAVGGGFQTEAVLNSRSYFRGITTKERLQKNDLLPILDKSQIQSSSNAIIKVNSEHFSTGIVKVYEGPEYYLLTNDQKKLLVDSQFTISRDNNRMGYRLNELVSNNLGSQITSAVLPGTVQLTPSGELIVLMRDCQVTGGYPRVLQLTEYAINNLAQKTTGDTFNFKIVPLT